MSVVPVDNPCGRPASARNVRITAYAPSQEKRVSVAPAEGIDIADFPSDTEQLSIEVEVGGGAVGAAGKTAPFDFLALETGAQLPIFLAPPSGFCPTVGAMNIPRIAPAVARAGAGVLVVGGHDENDVWTASAEYYDPMTSTFELVDVPDLFEDPENLAGFAGISLATLPDGRVAMSGGAFQQIAVFDPATRAFVSSGGIEGRAYHTSIALDDDRVLLAGGCPALQGTTCPDAEPRRSSKIYSLANTLEPEIGPNLRVSRLGATVFDIGMQRDGQRGFVIAGGQPPILAEPTSADTILVGAASDGFEVGNVHAQAAALDGGGVLTAFALDGAATPSGIASVIVPGQAMARPITASFVRDGARLVGLEDGRVLGVGGAADGELIVYDPTTDRWQTIEPAGEPPGPLTAPSLLRLADGSVLVLGSAIEGRASTSAWIYRPSIVGPAIGAMTVLPLDEATGVLTAEDPATVVRSLTPPSWSLVGGTEMARAIVGGPRRASGSITASVRVTEGGMALIGQQTGPGRAIVGELVEGSPARIVRLDAGQERVLCTGRDAPPLVHVDMTNTTVKLEISGGTARLSVESTVLASCDVDTSERGAWGVAALAGSTVTVAGVTVAR
ncbi:MAG: kelch repeat-containing protein [Kofleriaceae bacterium]